MLKKTLCLLGAMLLLLASCGTEEESSTLSTQSDASVLEEISSEQSDADVSPDESSAEESSSPEESSTPPIVIQPPETSDTPIDGEQMEGTFGKYTFVSEENGKRVAGIYSTEQIQDFVTRRENGEWYTITYDEMCYLVEDTFKLFEEYDLVRITDLQGEVHTYYGLSFYSSEEYYDCFNRLASSDDPACTFDLDQDIRDVTFMRLDALTTSVCHEFKTPSGWSIGGDPVIFYFGIEEEMSKEQMEKMSGYVWTVYNDRYAGDLSAYPYGVLIFCYQQMYAVPDVTDASRDKLRNFDPGERFAYNAGKYEYGNTEKTVIVEIQETKNYYPVARIRIDSEEHLAEIGDQWVKLRDKDKKRDPEDTFDQDSDYRIIVYLNGFPNYYQEMDVNDPVMRSIMYKADGRFNAFSLAHDGTLEDDKYHMGGCTEFATCINRIIQEIMGVE